MRWNTHSHTITLTPNKMNGWQSAQNFYEEQITHIRLILPLLHYLCRRWRCCCCCCRFDIFFRFRNAIIIKTFFCLAPSEDCSRRQHREIWISIHSFSWLLRKTPVYRWMEKPSGFCISVKLWFWVSLSVCTKNERRNIYRNPNPNPHSLKWEAK